MFGIPDVLGIKTAAISFAVALLIGLGGGAYAGYRWEKGEYEALKAADAKALADGIAAGAATQHAIDSSGQAAAVSEAYLRGKLDAITVNFHTEAPANVTITQDQEAAAADHAGCITYGFYRMLVAGERGVAAASLPLPAGAAVDACTAEPPSDLAAALAADLADGFGNGQQLDALIAELQRQEAIRLGKAPGQVAAPPTLAEEAAHD